MPLERRETQDWLRPGGPICLRPDPSILYVSVPLYGQESNEIKWILLIKAEIHNILVEIWSSVSRKIGSFIYPFPCSPVLPLVSSTALQWRRKNRERICSQSQARHSMPA
uniref:Uncharacterized protein n=1 Tax=Mesocestoides corti TaxID=53468 RepID=A0A5K3EJ27_MESCO